MERLTRHHFKKQDGFYMTCSEHCSKEDFSCEDCGELDKLVDRLGTIEDILGDDYDLDRLRELVEADRDGRCVVLPAKMGDDVWLIVTKRPRVTMPEFSFVKHSRLTRTNIERVVTEFGKTVFRTPEEAEAALERMKSNG